MQTRKSQRASDYLQRLWSLQARIRNKEREKEMWLDMATGTTSHSDGVRVQTSKEYHQMEKKVLEAVEIDREIAFLKEEITSIIRTIECLKFAEYDFLHKVYVQRMSLKEVHTMYGMSYSWATTMHSRALESLQQLLDEESQGD